MHVITNTAPIDIGKPYGFLPAGDWLLDDQNSFQIAARAERGTAKVTQDGWQERLSKSPDAKRLVIRSGAIGDLLMLTPVLAQRKSDLACFETHWPIFEGTGQKVVPYPLPLSMVGDYREIISLEHTMETDHENHATSVFARKLGVAEPLPSYKPIYKVTDAEKETAKKWLFTQRPNLAIQPFASVPNRSYPGKLWQEVIVRLEQRGWGILLMGRKGQISALPPRMASPFIRNLAIENLPLRESIAVLSQCTAFCGVDSSLMHFAGALDIPSVSLHGSFPWQIRTSHYYHNIAISGTGECANCCWHMKGTQMFPPDKPCAQTGTCSVLASIDPRRIVAKIDLLKP